MKMGEIFQNLGGKWEILKNREKKVLYSVWPGFCVWEKKNRGWRHIS
jgi:hypothetical protein